MNTKQYHDAVNQLLRQRDVEFTQLINSVVAVDRAISQALDSAPVGTVRNELLRKVLEEHLDVLVGHSIIISGEHVAVGHA